MPLTMSGSAAGVVPASAARPASHPTKSNSGCAVIAVTESIAPRPHRAWLATACAGQYPVASGVLATCQARNARSSPLSPGSGRILAGPLATSVAVEQAGTGGASRPR